MLNLGGEGEGEGLELQVAPLVIDDTGEGNVFFLPCTFTS